MDLSQFSGPKGLELNRTYCQVVANVVGNQLYDGHGTTHPEPLEALRAINFMHQRHGLSLFQEALLSSWFDQGTALGQIAEMVAVMEVFFKDTDISVAEIKQNSFVPYLLDRFQETGDEHYLDDIIFVESSRFVLCVDGHEIDPLIEFTDLKESLPENFVHEISDYRPAWELLTAAKLANQMLIIGDEAEAQTLYDRAESMCKNVLLTRRFQSIRWLLEGQHKEALRLAEIVHAIAPTATSLYLLYYLSENDKFLVELSEKYSELMLPHVKARLKGFL